MGPFENDVTNVKMGIKWFCDKPSPTMEDEKITNEWTRCGVKKCLKLSWVDD